MDHFLTDSSIVDSSTLAIGAAVFQAFIFSALAKITAPIFR
jgi:hypothetical protein